MVDNGWFDITTINNICKITGSIPEDNMYNILRTIHCVHFNKMPSGFREELMTIIKQVIVSKCISIEEIERVFNNKYSKKVITIESYQNEENSKEKKKKLFGFIGV